MALSLNNPDITHQLKAYKRKYYINKLLRGSLLFLTVGASVFLLVNSMEYAFRLNTPLRAALFFGFVIFALFFMTKWIIIPIIKLVNNRLQITNEEAARQIGNFFPEISDKLLNLIQLQNLDPESNSLIAASIAKKTRDLSLFSFPTAIKLNTNVKYVKFLAAPALIIFILLLFIPQFFSESTVRIVNYNKTFKPEAPFDFQLINDDLTAFKNEDFKLTLNTPGELLPEKVYLNIGERRIKMETNNAGQFTYTFQNLQRNIPFNFEASGFESENYELNVVNRPNLKNFNVMLDYPGYLDKQNERLDNVGNLQVPEGTEITWRFNTLAADSLWIKFSEQQQEYRLEKENSNVFILKKQLFEDDKYQVNLKNQYSTNKEEINYFLNVIPDQYPEINLEKFQDTTLYKFMVLGGNISDDYGLTRLRLYYSINKNNNQENNNSNFKSIPLEISKNQTSQSFYFRWNLDTLNLQPGQALRYYCKVWDNDGVNGAKATKTSTYTFRPPSEEEIQENIEKSAKETEKQIDKTLQEARAIKKDMEEAEKRVRGKKNLSWQDKRFLEELIKKREELNKEIESLRQQHQANQRKRDQFTQQSEKTKRQSEQLKKLMDELLDKETKKLYDELQKLLEEFKNLDMVREKVNQLSEKEENLEQELERTLELFKRLKFDQKLNQTINELKKNQEAQDKLQEQTKNQDKLQEQNKNQNNSPEKQNQEGNKNSQNNKKLNNEELAKKQDSLMKEFNEFKKNMDELQEINQDLKNPNPMQDFSKQEQEISREQQKAKEELQKNNRQKATQSQQKSQQKMKSMEKQLNKMQQSMEIKMLQENIDNLRNILDNLITLSFDQENLMKSFREVNQNDPRFVELSQEQLKLQNDAQIIEDSLMALAQRVFQIKSFVTRELGEMEKNMNATMDALKDRKQFEAISKQQFTMTSINNLALMLNDVLSNMQQQMASAMGKPSPQQSDMQVPSLSEMQKQLNQQMEHLKKSGKTGRQLSQSLAEMAAKQEQIRREMQKMKNKAGKEGAGGKLDEIANKMEKTEEDLVNKNLSEETIKRQKEIMTRLLDVEKSARKQDFKDERESETAEEYERKTSKSFEEYIKAKEQEIELLKTVPVKLNPYFKKEADKYFKRLEE